MMERIELIIADKDSEYIHRFLKYLRESEYRRIFVVKAFTVYELLNEYLDSGVACGIFCFSEDYRTVDYPTKANHFDSDITKIFLSQDRNTPEIANTINAIYKFQPLDIVLSEIYTTFLDKHPELNKNFIGKVTKILTVQALANEYYKNEFSYNLAKYLAGEGYKVFYLNLEWINGSEYFFGEPSKYDLSKIIYHLRKHPTKLATYIEKYKSNSIYYNLNYFERSLHVSELAELEGKDFINLINGFQTLSIYDYLIIDSEFLMCDAQQTLVNLSDYSIMLIEESSYTNTKISQLLDYLDTLKRIEKVSVSKELNYILVRDINQKSPELPVWGINFSGYLEKGNLLTHERNRDLLLYFSGMELFLKKVCK